MRTLMVPLPDEGLAALHVQPEQAADEIKMLVAVKLYEMGRISSSVAAEMAGISRSLFLTRLPVYGGAAYSLPQEEFDQDMQNALAARR